MRDALAAGKPGQFTTRTVSVGLDPSNYSSDDIRKTRERLQVSQPVFARLLVVSTVLVKSWERGSRDPSRIARRLLDEINRNPDHWIRLLAPRVPRVVHARKYRATAARPSFILTR